MKLHATILNSSDQTGMSKVALGKGEPYPYANMKKVPAGSIYVDTLNKCAYIRMGSTDEDWVLMGGTKIVEQKDSNPEKELRGLYSDGVLTLKILDDTKKYKFTFTGSYGTLTRTLDLSQLKRKF